MEERNKHIDDLFREEMGGYREVPPPRVWADLEQRLDGGRNKKRIIIWWCTALALLLALAGSLITGNVLPGLKLQTPPLADGGHPATTPTVQPPAAPTTGTNQTAAAPAAPVAAVATPAPAPTTIAQKNKNNEKQIRSLQNNRSLAAVQQPAAVAAPAPVYNAPATENIIAENSNKLQQTNTDATPAAIIPAQSTAPVPASAHNNNRLKHEMIDEMPLPVAGAPKAKSSVPQVDISQYEPLITRSKRGGNSLIAAAGKQIAAPMAASAESYNAPAIPAPQATQQPDEAPQNTAAAAPAPQTPVGADTNADTRPRTPLKWSYGLKTGYDISLNKYSAGNAILGAYLQAHISKRVSVILQPTIKYNSMKRTKLDGSESYYDVRNSSVTALHIITPEGADQNGNPVYNIIRRYFYSQQYDSVVVNKIIKPKQYAEFELPLLVQYKLTDHLSINAGISANFSKLVQAEREESRYNGLMRYDTAVFAKVNESSPAPSIPSIESRITYGYSPYSAYLAQKKEDPINTLRFNYMLGINYALRNGLSFDLLMLSILGNASYIENNDIRKIYKTPYIRIGVTYKLNNK